MKKKVLPRVFFDVEIAGNSVGRVIFELFEDVCPKTTENFRSLCTGERGIGDSTGKPLHYKGVIFHRVVRDFMIQGGDFSEGNGRGGESIYGGYFADESFERKHDKPFLLSMANRGKNTNGSQFFITTQPTPHLDGVHVVFGRVVDGEGIIKKVEAQPTDANSRPRNECKIVHCGELILAKTKKVKAKKKKESTKDSDDEDSDASSPDSSDSETESKKKKRKKKKKKHKKDKKKNKQRNEQQHSSAEENAQEVEESATAAARSTISAEEVPPVPEQRFLMRSDERREGDKTDSSATPASARSQSRQWVSRSGRKVKGRGVLRYRTPSRSRSRSRSPRRRSFRGRRGSETPPHWREAQRGQRPLRDVMQRSQESPESGRWRKKSNSPDSQSDDERKNRSNENTSSTSKTKKDGGEKDIKFNSRGHANHRPTDRDVKRWSRHSSGSGRQHDRDKEGDRRRDRSPRKRDNERRHKTNEPKKGNDEADKSNTSTVKQRHFKEDPPYMEVKSPEHEKPIDDTDTKDVLEDDQNDIEIAADDVKDDKHTVLPNYHSESSPSVERDTDTEKRGTGDGEKVKEIIEDSKAVNSNKTKDKEVVEEAKAQPIQDDAKSSPKDNSSKSDDKSQTDEKTVGKVDTKQTGEQAKKEDEDKEKSPSGSKRKRSRSSSRNRRRSRSSSRKRRRSRSTSRRRKDSRSRSRKRSRSPRRRRSRSKSPRRRSSYSRNRHSRSRSRDRHRRVSPRNDRSRRRSGHSDRHRSRSRSPRRRSPRRHSRHDDRKRSRSSHSRSRSTSKKRASTEKKSRSRERRSGSQNTKRKSSDRHSSNHRRSRERSSSRSSSSSD